METRHYTTVAQMSQKVDQIYELLARVKELAHDIERENMWNYTYIGTDAPEAIAEKRPLDKVQRLVEADVQRRLFREVETAAEAIEEMIGRNY